MNDGLDLDYQYTVTSVTGTEPLDITSVSQFARIDYSNAETTAVLQGLITQARMAAENLMSKALVTQTIKVLYTLPRIPLDTLSGADMAYEQNFYQYNESLGANPFSPAPYQLPVPYPPLNSVTTFEYRQTVFDAWTTWPQTDPNNGQTNWLAETTQQPGYVWLQFPPPAYQYQLTCSVGYSSLPQDILLLLKQLVGFWYDNRYSPMPANIQQALLAKKNWIL